MISLIILAALIIAAVSVGIVFVRDFIIHKDELGTGSWIKSGAVGFITNFLDVLGIGSFAPTTAGLRLLKQTEDRLIPGTLNVSCALPVIFEALLFIREVKVDAVTLSGMLGAAMIGGFIGAAIVSKLPAQPIRLVMGLALMLAAFLMLASKFGWMPGGGDAIGLTGFRLVIGIGVNFILGMLMCAGIGLYAPCMALVYVLGMSPLVAFPIMMGSCAFQMTVASFKFIKEGVYGRRASMAITIFGCIGVAIAFWIVKSLPLEILRWLVICVLTYTAITLITTFIKAGKAAESSANN
jgi:uncharacterized membrane protein YfcA